MLGTIGYLDLDNTTSYRPEHYCASCDSAKLQTGTYRVAVANYNAAEGRLATVKISSWNDGVVGTKSVTLGAVTGSVPTYYLFNVIVAKYTLTGKY